MRHIDYQDIVITVQQLCIECCYELPTDVFAAIEYAAANESNERAKRILEQLMENAQIAKQDHIPLCQDTGLTVVFVEQGAKTTITPPPNKPDATITDAINKAVEQAYDIGKLRKSVVAEPLHERMNTGTNTPAIIHHSVVPGEHISISVMAKGGGCENKSQFKMFNPTESKKIIMGWIVDVVRQAGANACPPFVVGVGIGGDFEQCCLISKKALLRDINRPNRDIYYAQMEMELMALTNALDIGPQGFGGDTTALAVKIETAPCHIASLPVAVNIECHSHRHKSAVL